MNWNFGKYILAVEWRSGTGLDIEFVSSRPVWCWEADGELGVAPFSGTVILLPLLVITFGYVYRIEELHNE